MKNTHWRLKFEAIERRLLHDGMHGRMSFLIDNGVDPEMFQTDVHSDLFKRFIELYKNGREPSLSNLYDIDKKLLAVAVDCDSMSSSSNIEHFVDKVKNVNKQLLNIDKLSQLLMAAQAHDPLKEEFFPVDEKIAALIDHQNVSLRTLCTSEGLADDAIESIERDVIEINSGSVIYIPTGIDKIDGAIGGLKKGKVYTIAARPGCGKTAMATNMCLTAAKNHFTPLYISIELGEKEIYERFLCTEGEIDCGAMSNRYLHEQLQQKIVEANNRISQLPILINATTGSNWTNAEMVIQNCARFKKCDVVFIDYIQQFRIKDSRLDLRNQLIEITSRCKQLAMQLDIPIVIMAQLNRDIEKRGEKSRMPYLSDLKESGSIEQDSDVVMILFMEDEQLWVNIAKNRSGKIGADPLNVNLSINKFYKGF